MDLGTLEKLVNVLGALVNVLGPGWTVVLIVCILALGVGLKVYSTGRLERAYDKALEEKERSVQRLANEARSWRILFLTHVLRISRQEAEKIIERNEFTTPEEARRELESRKRYERGERRARKKKRSRR